MRQIFKSLRLLYQNDFMICAAVFAAASCLYLRSSLPTLPGIDFGIYTYQAQQMLEGVPPYVSIFNGKFPLGTFVLLPGLYLARAIGWHDIHGIQFIYSFVGGALVMMIYMVCARLTRSRGVSVLAAFYYLNFREAWVHLYSYDPKTTASLFLLIYLYFLIRRNWFWTGIFLSCAVLCWQPAAIFILPLCIVLLNRSGKSILKNTAGLVFGALIPFVILFALFLYWGALHEMIEATIVYPLKYHYGTEHNPLRSNVMKFMLRKGAYDSVFVLFGFICLAGSFVMNLIFKKRQELIERVPLFFCFGIICIWSFIDFKDYRDMYPLLPYACLGIALFFNEILATETHKRFAFTLIMLSAVLCSALNPPVGTSKHEEFERTLRQLNELAERHAPYRRIAAAGLPEVAVYLNLTLISRYAYWGGGHMLFIEDHVPGGVGQLKEDIIKYDPEIIFVNKFYMRRYGRTLPRKYRRTMAVPGYPALINKNPNTEEWSQDADSQKSPHMEPGRV